MVRNLIPKRLYKYRAFSDQIIHMLVEDRLFFADPSTFNDPLDTKPSLETDIDIPELEKMLRQLVEQRVSAEMTAAAKTIGYRGPKTRSHITKVSQRGAEQLIADIRYHATNPEYEMDNPEIFILGGHIEEELLRRYDKGVASLAERANCPLMWSHYGDQHKGICVGYSVPRNTDMTLYKVKYGGSRLIKASTVAKMLAGDEEARQQTDKAVLSKKATDWRYEREWRLIGPHGLQEPLIELEEVIFGLRCPATVKYTVVKALESRDRAVKFYEMGQRHGTFHLKKYALDTDELTASFPRRASFMHNFFSAVP